MKLRFRKNLLRFILLFSLVIPYSLTIIYTDIFFNQEVSGKSQEIKSIISKWGDSLYSQDIDDSEDIFFSSVFVFSLSQFLKSPSCSISFQFFGVTKISFPQQSIPPPYQYLNS